MTNKNKAEGANFGSNQFDFLDANLKPTVLDYAVKTPEAQRAFCLTCRRNFAACIYARRLKICADCLNHSIWIGERLRYRAEIKFNNLGVKK